MFSMFWIFAKLSVGKQNKYKKSNTQSLPMYYAFRWLLTFFSETRMTIFIKMKLKKSDGKRTLTNIELSHITY